MEGGILSSLGRKLLCRLLIHHHYLDFSFILITQFSFTFGAMCVYCKEAVTQDGTVSS